MRPSFETLLVAGLVGLTAYAVLSSPTCRRACHAVFEPIAGEAGKVFASTAIGLLVASLA